MNPRGIGFSHLVEDEAALRTLVPPPPKRGFAKQIDILDRHARAWIEASPLVFIATADAEGVCDVSPRGGPAGWVRILDERRIALPDAPGNRRADTLRNVLANPMCGLSFVVPGRREVLRVNGRACVTTDPAVLDGIPGRPILAIGVAVREVYIHCGKAFIRSGLWEPDSWPAVDDLPSLPEILRDHYALNERHESIEQTTALVTESYTQRMW
jgi:PPOX class probable FMN-dependent enzyme